MSSLVPIVARPATRWRGTRAGAAALASLAGLAALAASACGEPATRAPPTVSATESGATQVTALPAGADATGANAAGAGAAGAREASVVETPRARTPAEIALAAGTVAADAPPVEERTGLTHGGVFRVTWAPVPDPIPFNAPFKLAVTIARAASPQTPERGARLELDATMPAHGHGMNRTPRVTANGDGTFLVEGMLLHMSGRWDLIFHVRAGSEYGQAILHLDLP